MLRPYRVKFQDGFETVLLLTEIHQQRDFPDAVLVEDDASAAPVEAEVTEPVEATPKRATKKAAADTTDAEAEAAE
jgi:hypothetical protein